MSTYAAYRRVSRVAGRDERLHSPEFQKDSIDRYADAHGLQIEHFEAELDVSGSRARRPILDTILARIDSGDLAGLIVADLDRLSRMSPRDRIELFERIEKAGGTIHSASQNLDATTPEGRFQRELFLSLARMQWEKYRDAWEKAKLRAVQHGQKLGQTPTGYRRRQDATLEPDPIEASIVKRAYEIAAREGIGEARDYLASMNMVARSGKYAGQPRRWTTATVRQMLGHRTYLGEIVHGDLTIPNTHEPLVTSALWLAAQCAPAARRKADQLPLTGLAECGTCGRPMIATRTRRGGESVRGYRCSGYRVHPNSAEPQCPKGVSIYADRLHEQTRTLLAEQLPTEQIGRHDNGKFEQARAAAETARAELAAYVEHTPASVPGYSDGLARRMDALTAAETAERETAPSAVSATAQTLWTENEIRHADDLMLRGIVRDTGVRVVVTGGRGTPIADRAKLIWP